MKRARRQHTVLLALCPLTVPVVGCALWLRAQQRQYAINRQLISAIVQGDDKRALALVEAGADPNTRYTPMPVPSLPELVEQFLHRSPPTANFSPTAYQMATGLFWVWTDKDGKFYMAQHGSSLDSPGTSEPRLLQTMIAHGAKDEFEHP